MSIEWKNKNLLNSIVKEKQDKKHKKLLNFFGLVILMNDSNTS